MTISKKGGLYWNPLTRPKTSGTRILPWKGLKMIWARCAAGYGAYYGIGGNNRNSDL